MGRFTADDAVPLDAISSDTPLIGLAEALADAPALGLDDTQAREVRDGKLKAIALLVPPPPVPGGQPYVRLLRADGRLLAVAERTANGLLLARVFDRQPLAFRSITTPQKRAISQKRIFG